MNEYKITYTSDPAVTGGTGTFTMSVEEMAEKAASEIVRLAEDPASREFQRAVSMHRNHSTYAKSIRELLGRVDSIRATNHAGA